MPASQAMNPPATRSWLRPGLCGRPFVYPVCTLALLVLNWVMGKDLPWDALHYHLYAGFSAVHERLNQDFFAAGPQAYFNPDIYLPFYWLVRAGLPDLAIASLLCAYQSSVLWLTYELALQVRPSGTDNPAIWVAPLAALLALLNPVLLQETGSSFADLNTTPIVLLGWVFLVKSFREAGWSRSAVAGILLGAACAFKLTNLSFVFAAIGPWLLLARSRANGPKLLALPLGLICGFVLVGGPWAWRLWQEFGNPLFPLFNSWFRSPDFTTEPLRHFRFIPDSLLDALVRPFAIAKPAAMIHVESIAPDLRYAVLVVLGLLFLAIHGLGRTKRWGTLADGSTRPPGIETGALALGLLLAWVFWLVSSANGRYFLPMSSVAAVLIAVLLEVLLGARRKLLTYATGLIVLLQLAGVGLGAELRANPVDWGTGWIDLSGARRLTGETNLYLTVGVQSNSFLAPFLTADSGMMNISGGYALGPEAPGGSKALALIARNWPRVRVVVEDEQAGRNPNETLARLVDGPLERFSLRADPRDCEVVAIPNTGFHLRLSEPVPGAHDATRYTSYLLNCGVQKIAAESDESRARHADIDLVFDRIEDACPKLFAPRRLVTEHAGSHWQRFYVNTDLKMWINQGLVAFFEPTRGDDPIYLGSEADWLRGPLRVDCGRKDGHYFARILPTASSP